MNGASTLGPARKIFAVHLAIRNYEHVRVLRDALVEDPEEKATKFTTQNVEANNIEQAIKMATQMYHWQTKGNHLGYAEVRVMNVAEIGKLDITMAVYDMYEKANAPQMAGGAGGDLGKIVTP